MRLRNIPRETRMWKGFGIEGKCIHSEIPMQHLTLFGPSYVVCTSRRPPVTWPKTADPSSSSVKTPPKVDETQHQQVFIGIFPASHIFVRDESSDAEGLADILTNGSVQDAYPAWARDMDVEDDGRSDAASLAPRKSFKLAPTPDQGHSSRARVPVYPASLRSASPTESQIAKPLPPRPSLRSGDDTVSGAEQPIVDEIASALREWHAMMYQYLARRDYKLFQIVKEHIETLHLGRRQLLAQTLSAEETVNLRRQCVARLVSANIAQGLDIIVRHPTWGGLVNVDIEGDIDPRSWVSAVRMYAMQVSLAYLEPSSSNPSQVLTLGAFLDKNASNNQLTRSLSTAENPRANRSTRSMGSLSSPSIPATRAKFFHIFLHSRAFVASPCAPGETAELFFSLYNANGSRFVSEDFCVILNHHGVLARDPNARIRTLFTDIVQSDATDPIYLVCRIVRNGSMKMGSTMGSIVEGGRRVSEASYRDINGSAVWTDPYDPHTNGRTASSEAQFRRPFGCAVLELSQLKQMVEEGLEVSSTREYNMPIYVPSHEATFSMLHQDIISKNVKEYEKSPR